MVDNLFTFMYRLVISLNKFLYNKLHEKIFQYINLARYEKQIKAHKNYVK